METKKQKERRLRIETAAYEVLHEQGYKAASMLAIAKRANCSNETLYRWYQNKQGLFASLVRSNAAELKQHLENGIETDGEPLEELRLLGPMLLQLVTGDRAVALNRAAAGDVRETGTLGRLIAQEGEDAMLPLISRLIEAAMMRGRLRRGPAKDISKTYTNLLIGDLQIQRAIGAVGSLSESEAEARTDRAVDALEILFA